MGARELWWAGFLTLAFNVLAVSPMMGQENPRDSLPGGVTEAMVQEGAQLFTSLGLCMACHGMDGKGLTAPDLTDAEWVHVDGSFESIVQVILEGVSLDRSKTGIPMLPKGGSQLTDTQIQAVAAYVWSISRSRTAPLSPGNE